MSAALPRHLVSVWNPFYAANAMEEHLAVLLHFAELRERSEAGDDDVYVWWGKVRSQNRQQPQANLDEILDIGRRTLESEETCLYLTDYRSLYVGDVEAIHGGDLPAHEREHVPAYYEAEELRCDAWFRLRDVRRLVADDLQRVIEELQALRNVHYNDRPVSLYGGMVDLPLIVTRPDGRRWFDDAELEAMGDAALWAELDAAQGGGVAAMERELRDNLLGNAAWRALEPVARTALATGEKVYREHRDDAGFDFGQVIGSFTKALEAQCNAVLRRALPRLAPAARLAKLGDRTVDLMEHRALTLGELVFAIGGERELNAGLCAALEHGGWFTGQLPSILDAIRTVRNPGVHEARVDRRTAECWRGRILGVGCEGIVVELARVQPRR